MSSYNLHRSGEAIDELLTTLMDKGHVGQILKRDSDNDMVWEPITAENVTDSLGYVPMSMPTNQGTIDQVLRSNGEGGTYWAEDTNQAKINSAVNTWMDGHISENNTVALDDSLTQTGAAAQAKAAGDMIIAASTQPSQTTNKLWINTANAPDVQLATSEDLENIIAPEYSSSATYNVGDYVLYNDTLYRCKVAITTAEEWTAAHWTSAVLGQDVCDLKSALDELDNSQKKLVFNVNSETGTVYIEWSSDIPAGSYTLNIGGVTTTDTDDNASRMAFYNGSTQVTRIDLSRNITIEQAIAFDNAVTRIVLLAGTKSSTSTGDTISIQNFKILKETNLNTRITAVENAVSYLDGEVTNIEDSLYVEALMPVDLTLTEGTYYRLNGNASSYANAKSSQAVPVEAGKKVYVTATSQDQVAGILFYNSDTLSDSTFVSYDCYTGSAITYTDQEVTVPPGATYAIVQGNKSNAVGMKETDKVSRIDQYDDEIEEAGENIAQIFSNNSYAEKVLCQRLMALGKKSGFTWGTYPKMILTLRVDDLRADVDKIAKIVMDEYNLPLVVAACVENINESATGITDPAEKIGDTRLEVCQWVQEHGGEIVVHPDRTVTSGDYETSIKPLFLDSKRTFEENGIHIRGTAVANGFPSESLKKQLDPYLYGFYDYSDDYGSVAPYTGISTYMINHFSSGGFEEWLNRQIAQSPAIWKTVVMHQLGDDVTEQQLRDILDVIQTYVNNESIIVTTWSNVFDDYGT